MTNGVILLTMAIALLVISCGDDDDDGGCAESPEEFLPTVLERAHAGDSEGLTLCLGSLADPPGPTSSDEVMAYLSAIPEDAPVVFTEEVADNVYLTGITGELTTDVPGGDIILREGRFVASGFLVHESDGSWRAAPPGELYVLNVSPVSGDDLRQGDNEIEFQVEESSGILTTPSARVWVNGSEVEVESLAELVDPVEDIGHFQFTAELQDRDNWVAIYLEQPEGRRTGGIIGLPRIRPGPN